MTAKSSLSSGPGIGTWLHPVYIRSRVLQSITGRFKITENTGQDKHPKYYRTEGKTSIQNEGVVVGSSRILQPDSRTQKLEGRTRIEHRGGRKTALDSRGGGRGKDLFSLLWSRAWILREFASLIRIGFNFYVFSAFYTFQGSTIESGPSLVR